MEQKEIKGTFDYTLKFTDTTVEVLGNNNLEDGLAAILIALTTVENAKENCIRRINQTKGKDINRLRDRIGKFNSSVISLQLLASDMSRVILEEERLKEKIRAEVKKEDETPIKESGC